ncbi:MAG: VOC family protein [Alphaproteobacteria bacterium]|nr:VOC family protein [Alphaproteobacteria bacterium]
MRFERLLFLAPADDARTALAVALARSRFGGAVRVGPSAPASEDVVRVLAELGIEPAEPSDLDPADADLVIALSPDAPPTGNARRLTWSVADPSRTSGEQRLQAFRATRDALRQRIDVLAALRDVPEPLAPIEFHASVRVPDLAAAARFYTWLLGVEPREWTHRYVTFVSEPLRTNFVVLVDDGLPLHQDTLYHLGIELPDRAAVIDAHHRALAAGWTLHKPARTTWRGTPLHELWLKDPGGNLIEVYARLTEAELAQMPDDKEPVFLA